MFHTNIKTMYLHHPETLIQKALYSKIFQRLFFKVPLYKLCAITHCNHRHNCSSLLTNKIYINIEILRNHIVPFAIHIIFWLSHLTTLKQIFYKTVSEMENMKLLWHYIPYAYNEFERVYITKLAFGPSCAFSVIQTDR